MIRYLTRIYRIAYHYNNRRFNQKRTGAHSGSSVVRLKAKNQNEKTNWVSGERIRSRLEQCHFAEFALHATFAFLLRLGRLTTLDFQLFVALPARFAQLAGTFQSVQFERMRLDFAMNDSRSERLLLQNDGRLGATRHDGVLFAQVFLLLR